MNRIALARRYCWRAPTQVVRLFQGSSRVNNEAPLLPGLSPEQIRKVTHLLTHSLSCLLTSAYLLTQVGEMDKLLRERHMQIEANMKDPKERDIARRKRIIYRSKQRGWLEADLLLGSWAKENVPTLNEKGLEEIELILKEETIDVYNYVSKKDPLPDHLKSLEVMKQLQDYALKRTMATPEGYKITKEKNNLI